MMPRTRVKFCGITRPEDAAAAATAGADAIGMILHANAKRKIALPTAEEIVAALPPYVSAVGVFVDAPVGDMRTIAKKLRLSHVQLHGDETPETLRMLDDVRAVKVLKVDREIESRLQFWWDAYSKGILPNLVGILLDSAGGGGTGHANDFDRIHRLVENGRLTDLPPLTVAGGLRPDTVGAVARLLRPYAVDTSSGIETEFGKKSPELMRAFVDAVRAND